MAAHLAGLFGYDLVARNFYSPVPDWRALPAGAFDRRSELPGIVFDLDRQLQTLRGLERHLAEFQPPPGFDWANETYGPGDADVLYAMLRSARPRRVLELGSGVSSLVISAALARNAADGGGAAVYDVYDPYARDFIRSGVAGMTLHSRSATEVDVGDVGVLAPGDVLFIDTTHTVKLAGEVNHIVLELLPALAEGVLVHVHDIFLPYEYPRSYFERGLYWGEQYLLQAFLTGNPDWEVVIGLHALAVERGADLGEVVGSFRPGVAPGAFWMRRVRASTG